jgi:hypothetical protein
LLARFYNSSALSSHALLQGRKHAKTKSVLPLFRCLGPEAIAQVDRLLDAMFNVTIPSFHKGGVHRKVLQQFALALIRHDAEVVSRCGVTNQVSHCLRQAARKAQIVDSRFPGMCPEFVIVKCLSGEK